MKEDFVSFELAKKLVFKGFNDPCIAHYYEGFLRYNTKYPFALTAEELLVSHNSEYTFVDAPTISQVLDWLRKEKKILVVAAPAFLYKAAVYFWQCGIYEISLLPNAIPWHKFINNQKSYESAILAGIEYVIDNVI